MTSFIAPLQVAIRPKGSACIAASDSLYDYMLDNGLDSHYDKAFRRLARGDKFEIGGVILEPVE